jgi:hypothetical protein
MFYAIKNFINNVFYTLQDMYIFTSNFTHLWNFSLTYACCCMYSRELLMMDGKTVRNMYSYSEMK